jgi:serine phosphatase RsbU (regulator of sigma subunit)
MDRSFTAADADLVADSVVVARVSLGTDGVTAREARRLAVEALTGFPSGDVVDDTAIVVTELVTNALLHGLPPAQLLVRVDGTGAVRVEVSDASPVLPVRVRQDRESMTGRGLKLVEASAERWGVQRQPVGKTVWAELRPGASSADLDASPDELLAGWPDLDDEGFVAVDESTYTVYLGDVPTDLLLAAKAHVDNLVREFFLAASGAQAGTTGAVPLHLVELIDAVVHGFAAPREAIKRQALAAAHAGKDHVRLELSLPLSAADAGVAYLHALDQFDDYCRGARMLTLESPPQHRVFRRWYVEELIGQLRRAADGRPPMPPETFEQRLLHEIDAIAAAERTAERSARLNALTAVLASAVTPAAVTQAVLRDGVETLRASGGAVLLPSSGSALILSGAVGYDDHVVAGLRAEPADADLPAALAIRSHEPVWLESREEREGRFPQLAGLEPATVAMCAVPLMVGERCLGALRFSFAEARLFHDDEREFVLAMAAQTAQALDRAQLYAQRTDIFERLQRSLLPPRLPIVPGMRIEAAYYPLGVGIDIGGDFYDLWPCAEQQWAFAIGDASGTGPEAAAMTALVRHTLRALTLNDMAPQTVLHQLNRALREGHPHPDDDRFCTVLLGTMRVEPERAVLELVSGGHPGPLVARARGVIEEVELTGSLLGLLSPAQIDRRTVVLERGDEILLYTDGVTDTRGQGFFGVDGIVEAMQRAREAERSVVEEISEAVRAHGGGVMDDDVALFSLRFDGG